jgi:hypothetical protein
MVPLVREKFMNFVGQPCAKLDRRQPIYEEPRNRRSALITIISPLLFFAPDVNLKALEKVWIDRMICQVPWKAWTAQLIEEWRDFVGISTILRQSSEGYKKSCVILTYVQWLPIRRCLPSPTWTMDWLQIETPYRFLATYQL